LAGIAGLIFPYTEIQPGLARELSLTIRPLCLYQAAGMTPPAGLEPLLAEGAVLVKSPEPDLAPEQVKAALAELRRWILGVRDLKEIIHLRSLGPEPGAGEPAPSALAAAIRQYGRDPAGQPLGDHLILHLALEHDHRLAELTEAVDRLIDQERRLGRAMGLKAGEPEEEEAGELKPALDPLDLPDPDQGPLLELRLKAWAGLFRAEPVAAGLWLTSPAVTAWILSRLEERGRTFQPAREEDGLRFWPLPAGDLGGLLGLDLGQGLYSGLVAEVLAWPSG